MPQKITPSALITELSHLNLGSQKGVISFNFAGVSVKMRTTDTVGITLQAWLKQYLTDRDYFFSEPENTQEFPDFFLDDIDKEKHMLEVKAFNFNATPAFDIANFESYCASVKEKPYRLDADYLIFGYIMSPSGDISVPKIWLKKIWEIAGTSSNYPLKTQVKRDVIYNIRPNSDFKIGRQGPFKSKDDFLNAIYGTLKKYRGLEFAEDWKNIMATNYEDYFGYPIVFQ